MRAALYARVSTEDQAEKYGLDSQRRTLTELAAARGWEVVGEYVDDGYSRSILERPALARLRDAIWQGAVDVVLIHDPDRLARDLTYALLLEREFEKAGVALEYATVPTDRSPAGRLQRQVLGAIAEFERKKIIERTVRGKRERASQGKATGGPPPYGYRYDDTQPSGLAIDEERADVLRRMVGWLVSEGLSVRDIARRLNAQGMRPPRGGSRWNRSTVNRILRNEAAAGRTRYFDHEVAPPPIISAATFARAQTQLKRNRVVLHGRPARRPCLLKGLLVCGQCGRRLHSYSAHGPVPRSGMRSANVDGARARRDGLAGRRGRAARSRPTSPQGPRRTEPARPLRALGRDGGEAPPRGAPPRPGAAPARGHALP